jgi:hypothetical protein
MEVFRRYRRGRHRWLGPAAPGPETAQQPPEQRRLDNRYRLIELVAHGGWSTVWRGYDERLCRPVAIKMLNASQAKWVHGEASSLARLTHPHIATVYDYGNTGTEYYIVLEFVEGRSLADALGPGPLPWSSAARYGAQLASALAAAHRRGLVHRDVTPGNVMLTSSGVKLIDFGISVVEGERETDIDGEARGTPPYVAPERLTGDVVSPAGDVFGLGVVLYRAIAGHPPWVAGTVSELLSLQASTDPAPLPAVAGLPGPVAQACLRCLSRDPTERPTAEQMANLLADAAALAPVPPVVDPVIDEAEVTRALRRPTRMTAPIHTGSIRLLRWVTAGFAASLVVGLGWVLTGWGPGDTSVTATVRPATAGPVPPACVVAYQRTSAPGQPFAATATVTNTGQPLASGWRLSLAGRALTSQQYGDATASVAQNPLGHGESVPMSLTASAPAADPMPESFRVNGQPCLAVAFPFLGTDTQASPTVVADGSRDPVAMSDSSSQAKPAHPASTGKDNPLGNDNAGNARRATHPGT